MKVFVYSEKGTTKKICEDAAVINREIFSDTYYACEADAASCIVALADGVGGNAGGDCASRYVLDQMKEIPMIGISKEMLKQYILEVNKSLLQYSLNRPTRKNMATTMTGVIFASEGIYLYHIGNTRLYLLQRNNLKQVTQDQTTYQWLINRGQLENAKQCNKNEIMYCMGGGNEKFVSGILIDENTSVKTGKRILMTTDGIHEYLSIDELEEFMIGDISEKKMKQLAEMASLRGSVDDKTILVIDKT